MASALVVRHVNHGRARALVEARELVLHGGAQVHVEIGERLVEQHERRLGDEAARERDALTLAARELAGPPRTEALQLDRARARRRRAVRARDP